MKTQTIRWLKLKGKVIWLRKGTPNDRESEVLPLHVVACNGSFSLCERSVCALIQFSMPIRPYVPRMRSVCYHHSFPRLLSHFPIPIASHGHNDKHSKHLKSSRSTHKCATHRNIRIQLGHFVKSWWLAQMRSIFTAFRWILVWLPKRTYTATSCRPQNRARALTHTLNLFLARMHAWHDDADSLLLLLISHDCDLCECEHSVLVFATNLSPMFHVHYCLQFGFGQFRPETVQCKSRRSKSPYRKPIFSSFACNWVFPCIFSVKRANGWAFGGRAQFIMLVIRPNEI